MRQNWKLFMICAACLMVALNSIQAQSISTTTDRNNILIGEPVKYRVLFTFPEADYRVEFNVPDSIPHFETMSNNKFDSTYKQDFYIVQDLTLTSWDSGSWIIPSLNVNLVRISSGQKFPLKTDSLAIEVGYAPADSTGQLRDIKPIREVTILDLTWLYITLAALALILLIYLLVRYFKKRPKKVKQDRGGAYKEAMKSLDDLQKMPIDSQEAAKAFYTALGDIFKKYYQRKSSLDMKVKTSKEIVRVLRNSESTGHLADFVQEALDTSDSTKFAKYLPPAEENIKCCDIVRTAISRIEKMNPTA